MSEWHPIKTAPYQETIEVRNPQLDNPVLATRGFMTESGMHPDTSFCTSVFTPGEFFPFPSGRLVCPTEWRNVSPQPSILLHL